MASETMVPALIERLASDHARIASATRELSNLTNSPTGQEGSQGLPDWGRIEELLEFLCYYADRIHHPLEDRLFDRLLNKGLTPTERRLVFRNLEQHEQIRDLTDRMLHAVTKAPEWMSSDSEEFAELASNYLGLQSRHMKFEETQLFPLVQQRFDNNDWNTIAATGGPEETHE